MKALKVWVAVDDDGAASIFKMKPRRGDAWGYLGFVNHPKDEEDCVYVGVVESHAGKRWRASIPLPKPNAKKRGAKK